MILNKRLGYYMCGNFHVVPYRHHYHLASWKVLVNQHVNDRGDIRSFNFNVCASTAFEAAKASMKAYEDSVKEQKLIREIEKEIENERRQAILNAGTEGKPPLDQLQCKTDSKVTIRASIDSGGNLIREIRKVNKKR